MNLDLKHRKENSMTDKVQKIREEIERLFNHVKDSNFESDSGAFYYLKDLLDFIDSMQEEPVSEDLEKAIRKYEQRLEKENPATEAYDFASAIRFGANWQKEQFEKNRLKHCDSISNKQAELEQGFIDQHLDKYQRMPTFLDAIEYGMRLQNDSTL